MKTVANKANANKTAKGAHALKTLLEKQETNLLEIKEDLPFESPDQVVNARTVQFGSERPVLPAETSSNLSEAISIFNELIRKEIVSAASLLEINELELKAWIDLQIEVPAKKIGRAHV